MLRSNNNLSDPLKRRGSVWFALLSVAWLQLSVAVHQFDHVADYVDETCKVCTQFDRIDDAVVDHSAFAAITPLKDFLTAKAPTDIAGRTFIRGFDSRAPPQL